MFLEDTVITSIKMFSNVALFPAFLGIYSTVILTPVHKDVTIFAYFQDVIIFENHLNLIKKCFGKKSK